MREYFEQEADPEMLAQCDTVCELLASRGVTIVEHPLPGEFDEVAESHANLMKADAAFWHQANFLAHRSAYPAGIAQLVEEGLLLRGIDYVQALRHRSAFTASLRSALAEVDFALMPAAPGPAPEPGTTGSARFNSPWSFAGFPAISVPAGLSRRRLPLGVQLVAGPDQEDALLNLAGWVEGQLAFDRRPD
jgi:aspartyl-tRNA(Asn)/glutamyl-tRNA(Gln) amidotransferase subunit A